MSNADRKIFFLNQEHSVKVLIQRIMVLHGMGEYRYPVSVLVPIQALF